MIGADITFAGADDLLEQLRALPERALRAAGAELYQRAEAIMADAKENYVPVDLGALRDSGHVEPPVFADDGVRVTLGFGGAAQDYALIQHEDMSLHHPNGGGPKFLERPLLQHGETLVQDMADGIRSALGMTS